MTRYFDKLKCFINIHDFIIIRHMSLSSCIFRFLKMNDLNPKIYNVSISKDKILIKKKCSKCNIEINEILEFNKLLKKELITNKKNKIKLN